MKDEELKLRHLCPSDRLSSVEINSKKCKQATMSRDKAEVR